MATKTKKQKAESNGKNDGDPIPKSRIEDLAEKTIEGLDLAAQAEAKLAVDPSADVSPELNRIAEILDPAKAYDSPEALAAWDQETAREAELRRRKRAELWAKEDVSKAVHKADKAAAEEYDTDFFNWLRERNEQRGKPPTPKPAKLYPDPTGATDVDESWKEVRLDTLDLTPRILKALEAAEHKDRGPLAPIVTLGQLAAYQEPESSGYTKRLTDLKGIGKEAADAIGEASIKFWEARRSSSPKSSTEVPEQDPDD